MANGGYDRRNRTTIQIRPATAHGPAVYQTMIRFNNGMAGAYGDASHGGQRIGNLSKWTPPQRPTYSMRATPPPTAGQRVGNAVTAGAEKLNKLPSQQAVNNAIGYLSGQYKSIGDSAMAGVDAVRAAATNDGAQKRALVNRSKGYAAAAKAGADQSAQALANMAPFGNPVLHGLQGKFDPGTDIPSAMHDSLILAATMGMGEVSGSGAWGDREPVASSTAPSMADQSGSHTLTVDPRTGHVEPAFVSGKPGVRISGGRPGTPQGTKPPANPKDLNITDHIG